MASNNNDDKKQKKTEVVEHVNPDSFNNPMSLPLSLSAPVVVNVLSALSFGTILEEFPDFFSCVLLYIADRVIWNSIASSNKDIYAKSKAIRPPWPLYYKLPSFTGLGSWSPCGTRIACTIHSSNIAIFDQRHGHFRHNENYNHEFGWPAHDAEDITDLEYSPDGRFLVSIGDDEFVRLWDSTRDYEQIQEWNMREEVVQGWIMDSKVSVSACSKYIAVSARTHVFLKDVEKGSTIQSLLLPGMNLYPTTTRFSSDTRAIFICLNFHNDNIAILVWRPYLDLDNEDRLITLWGEGDSNHSSKVFEFSHDNTMVAVREKWEDKGKLYFIDTDQKCLTKKLDFQGSTGLHFTPNGKYIVFNQENERPTLWSIAEGTYTNKTIHFFDNGSNTKHNNLVMEGFSSNNRLCIVGDPGTDNCCITSYFVK